MVVLCDIMYKPELTKQDVDNLKKKIYLTELQERILEYRMKEYSITKMSMLEHCSERTISREINKLKKKIINNV